MSAAEWMEDGGDGSASGPVRNIIDELAFFKAVRQNQVTEVKRVLEMPECNVNMRDKRQLTPLILAASLGHDKVCEMLLERGADVHAKTAAGDTALHWAAYKGHATIVEALLKRGADPSATGEGGMTPLHYAASGGFAPVVELLLQQGADISVRNRFGNTVSMLASSPACRALLAKVQSEPRCGVCSQVFSQKVLRYLCAECKSAYCSNCTSVVALGEQAHDRPVRVCRNCVATIEEKIQAQKRAEAEALARQLEAERQARIREEEERRRIEEEERAAAAAAAAAAAEAERLRLEEEQRKAEEERQRLAAEAAAKAAAKKGKAGKTAKKAGR